MMHDVCKCNVIESRLTGSRWAFVCVWHHDLTSDIPSFFSSCVRRRTGHFFFFLFPYTVNFSRVTPFEEGVVEIQQHTSQRSFRPVNRAKEASSCYEKKNDVTPGDALLSLFPTRFAYIVLAFRQTIDAMKTRK